MSYIDIVEASFLIAFVQRWLEEVEEEKKKKKEEDDERHDEEEEGARIFVIWGWISLIDLL